MEMVITILFSLGIIIPCGMVADPMRVLVWVWSILAILVAVLALIALMIQTSTYVGQPCRRARKTINPRSLALPPRSVCQGNRLIRSSKATNRNNSPATRCDPNA